MSIAKIRKRLSAGFKPFAIRTSDGREYEVPHPEFILLGRFDIAVTDSEGEIALLDPLHIVALKNLSARKAKPS